MIRRRLPLALGAVTVLGATAVLWPSSGGDGPAYSPGPSGPDGLVGNEHAHWNGGARRSPDWDVTSGSLYLRSGVGWTGVPDAATPDETSSRGTGSSVFRMNTRRADFGDVTVALRVRVLRLLDRGGRRAPAATDGVHLLLRRRDEAELYVASLVRRDGTLVVKKKLRGGTENGGTYTTLGAVPYRPRPGQWHAFEVGLASTGRSEVAITVSEGGHRLLRAVDTGRTITAPGSVGLRGDNCEFEFGDVAIRPA